MRILCFALALVCSGPAVAQPARGAAGTIQGAAKPAAAPGKGAQASAQSDAAMEAAIRAKFAKSKIGTEHFQVHVQGGIASIEGKTETVQHKGVATRLAKTAGARAVNNHIQISDSAKQKAAANLEAGRRRVQIKRSDPRSDPRSDADAKPPAKQE